MTLIILDPGYEHVHAHHHAVNIGIHQAWQKKGVSVTVLAGQSLDQAARSAALGVGMEAVPYFSTPCYPPNADKLPSREHEVLAGLYAHEIVRLFTSGFLHGEEDLLIHTCYSFHIAGVAQALWRIQGFAKGARLLLSAMFHPGAKPTEDLNSSPEHLDCREHLRYRLALKLLHTVGAKSGIDVCLATSCRVYQRIYQTLWPGGNVVVHPAVGYRPLQCQSLAETARTQVLLYMGGAKADKGIVFAAQLGAAAALSYPHAEFVFHFNDAFPGAQAYKPVVDGLVEAGTRHNNVLLVRGNLDQEKYDELLQSSTIVCLLYDPAHYGFKTSGVFWDALRKENCRWLVTANTWPAEELKELGIAHALAQYGDVAQGVIQLGALLAQNEIGAHTTNPAYRNLLNSPFGDWLHEQFTKPAFNKKSCFVAQANPDFKTNRGRILVARTKYGHFSPFSGPAGFIPYLRGLGYQVDEMLIPLGNQRIEHVPQGLREEFKQLTDTWLRSYQGNAMLAETDIQRRIEDYDFIHFLDAEHCGLLTALLKLLTPSRIKASLIATYHQPTSIMRDIVADPIYLKGFDRIHLMSPCQAQFFKQHLGANRLAVVPHGLALELTEETLPACLVGPNAGTDIPQLCAALDGRTIILTVGGWLRDFDQLLATAQVLHARADLIFVVVSRGLQIDAQHLRNVLILNEGLSDSQLHALYLQASLLFLPLKDGAANNAILEAMAHGLPIVTTDLPSTRFYTEEQAAFCRHDAQTYAETIEYSLLALRTPGERSKISTSLKKRGQALAWKRIAQQMHEHLYRPLAE